MQAEKNLIRLLFLVLIAAAFSLPTFADTYQITFTGTDAPATTTFIYDPATGFGGDLTLVWHGLTFTYSLWYLNHYNSHSSCPATATGANAFQLLTGATTCNGALTGSWQAHTWYDVFGWPASYGAWFDFVPCPYGHGQCGASIFGFVGTLPLSSEFEYWISDPLHPMPAGWTFVTAGGTYTTVNITQPIPEPGTLLLLGTGLAGLWLKRRKG